MRVRRLPPLSKTLGLPVAFALALAASACDDAGEGISEEEAALSDLSVLLDGAPNPDKLPDEPKSDAIYPAKFDLVALQSQQHGEAFGGVPVVVGDDHRRLREALLARSAIGHGSDAASG